MIIENKASGQRRGRERLPDFFAGTDQQERFFSGLESQFFGKLRHVKIKNSDLASFGINLSSCFYGQPFADVLIAEIPNSSSGCFENFFIFLDEDVGIERELDLRMISLVETLYVSNLLFFDRDTFVWCDENEQSVPRTQRARVFGVHEHKGSVDVFLDTGVYEAEISGSYGEEIPRHRSDINWQCWMNRLKDVCGKECETAIGEWWRRCLNLSVREKWNDLNDYGGFGFLATQEHWVLDSFFYGSSNAEGVMALEGRAHGAGRTFNLKEFLDFCEKNIENFDAYGSDFGERLFGFQKENVFMQKGK